MANNRRKSAAIALAVLGVAGLSLASASQLTLTSGSLQAGVTNLTDCQVAADGAITVGFANPTFSGGVYNVGTVTLANVPAACATKAVRITVLNTSNAAITEVTGTLNASGTFSSAIGTVPTASLRGAAVVISD